MAGKYWPLVFRKVFRTTADVFKTLSYREYCLWLLLMTWKLFLWATSFHHGSVIAEGLMREQGGKGERGEGGGLTGDRVSYLNWRRCQLVIGPRAEMYLYTLILIPRTHLQNWHRREHDISAKERMQRSVVWTLGNAQVGLGGAYSRGGAVITKSFETPYCAPKSPSPPSGWGSSKI